jgi:hypothetical protein
MLLGNWVIVLANVGISEYNGTARCPEFGTVIGVSALLPPILL